MLHHKQAANAVETVAATSVVVDAMTVATRRQKRLRNLKKLSLTSTVWPVWSRAAVASDLRP